jgi:hypothetical protein
MWVSSERHRLAEVVDKFVGLKCIRQRLERRAAPRCVGFAPHSVGSGEHLLDRVAESGLQAGKAAASRTALPLEAAEFVHDGDIARPQRRRQELRTY